MSEIRSTAFVLMPFEESLSWLWDDVLSPNLTECGYLPLRADTVLTQQNILRDIVRGIVDAHLIVADLTNLNPNVMYELGLAHALRKSVLLISQDISSVPFDLRAHRIIPYSSTYREVTVFIDHFKTVAREHLSGAIQFGNPIEDFYPEGAVASSRDISPQGTDSPGDEVQDLTDNGHRGLLDFEQDFQLVVSRLTAWIEEVGQVTTDFAQNLVRRTERLNSLDPSEKSSFRARTAAAESVAALINSWTEDLANKLPLAESLWIELEAATEGILSSTRIETEEDREAALQLVSAMNTFVSEIDTALDGIGTAQDSINQLGSLSRSLRVASSRASKTLNSLTDNLTIGKSFGVRTATILQDRLELQP